MDYEIQRPTRHCFATQRELAPGEAYFSVLLSDGDELHRRDFSVEAWAGPPEDAVGWWKAEIPSAKAKKRHWAPNDVMLQFFDELEGQEGREEMRYILALLLVRRRVMRHEETEQDEERETLVLYCPRREETYHVEAAVPDAERAEAIQNELAALLE